MSNRTTATFCILAACLATTGCSTARSLPEPIAAAAPAPAPVPDPWSAIDAAVEQARAEAGFPAVAVAVGRGGELLYDRAFGFSDLENRTPATPDSVFRIASVSKPITATAVMQLVEAGKIDLAASIRDYVPSLPAAYRKVMVADLLRHTSGVRHYKSGAEYVTTRHCDTLADALAIFASDPLDHPPGEKITYTTFGYVLLGLAVEKASGSSFADYVRTRIFEPAGMASTRLDTLDLIPNRAEPYSGEKGAIRNAPLLDTSCRVPGGGLVSTAADLVRFAGALQDGRLVRPETAATMMRSQITDEIVRRTLAGVDVPPDYKPPGMGFGWAVATEEYGVAPHHGGNQPGATSMLYLVPGRGLSIAILTNLDGQGGAATDLAKAIVRAIPPQP